MRRSPDRLHTSSDGQKFEVGADFRKTARARGRQDWSTEKAPAQRAENCNAAAINSAGHNFEMASTFLKNLITAFYAALERAAGGAPYPKLTVALLKKYRICEWTRTRFNRSLKKKRVFALGATTRSNRKVNNREAAFRHRTREGLDLRCSKI
jgi:hypothetical protein